MAEDSLERQAMEELLLEAKRGAERAKDMGAFGWQKPPIPPANKRFLTNMLVSTLRDAERQNKKQADQFKDKNIHHKFDTRQHPYKHERSSFNQKYNYSESYQRTSQKQEVGQSGIPAQQTSSKWDSDEKREHRSKHHIEVKEEANTNSPHVRAVGNDRSGSSDKDTGQTDKDEEVSALSKSKELENHINLSINPKQNLEDSKRGDKNEDKKIVKKNVEDLDLQDDQIDKNHAEDSRKSKHEKSSNGFNSILVEDSGPDLDFDNHLEESLSRDDNALSDRTKKQMTKTVNKELTSGKGRKRKRKKVKSKRRHKGREGYISQMSFDLSGGNDSKRSKTNHNSRRNKNKKKSKHKKKEK